MPTLFAGGAKAQGTVEIFFRQVGLKPLHAQSERVFREMSGRASYYAGMIQARLGMAFLGLSAAIAAFGVISVKKFAEFDQAMMNTASVTGATVEQMEFLREVAKDLGKIGTASAKDVADAMYFLGSAGYEVGEIFHAIEPIMKLAVATQADMSDVARITMQSLKAFGKEAQDATHFAQVFAAGISSTQLRIEWLGQSMKHVGPVAREMGMSIEETVAVLGMLHDAGIQAGMAGRHLRRILQGTVKTTPQVIDVLERLGLKTQDISIQMFGFEQVMKNLNKAGATLGDVFKLFGLRASASGAVLKRNIGDFSEYLAKIKDAAKLQAMFNKQMQGLQAQFKKLSNVFNVWMINFAESFIPIVRWFVKVLTEMIDKLAELPPWVHKIMAIGAAISALAFAFAGLALILIGTLTQGMMSIKLLGMSIMRSFQMLAGVVVRLARVIVISLVNAMFRWNYSVSQLGLAFANIKKMGLIVFFKRLALTMVTGIRMVIASLAKILIPLAIIYANIVIGIAIWQKWQNVVKKVIDNVKLFLGSLKTKIKEVVDFWVKQFEKIKLPRFLQVAIDFWVDKFKNGAEKTKEAFIDLADTIKAKTETFKEAAKMTAEDLKEANRALLSFIEETWGKIFPKDKLDELKKAFSDMFGPVKDGLEEIKEAGGDTIGYLGEKMSSFKDSLEKTWTDTIFELVKGTKTWLDVWHMVLDDALKTFIHGFVKKVIESWIDALWTIHETQASMGGGIWGNILKIGGALAGAAGGGVGTTAGGLTGDISEIIPAGGLSPAASFQHGTNFVPKDMLAFLHRGEAVVPANENGDKMREITIVNVIDPSFVPASIARDPNVIINVINDDVIMAGSTRRTLRRYLR